MSKTLEERLPTLESQFVEGLKLVVRIRALRDAQRGLAFLPTNPESDTLFNDILDRKLEGRKRERIGVEKVRT